MIIEYDFEIVNIEMTCDFTIIDILFVLKQAYIDSGKQVVAWY